MARLSTKGHDPLSLIPLAMIHRSRDSKDIIPEDLTSKLPPTDSSTRLTSKPISGGMTSMLLFPVVVVKQTSRLQHGILHHIASLPEKERYSLMDRTDRFVSAKTSIGIVVKWLELKNSFSWFLDNESDPRSLYTIAKLRSRISDGRSSNSRLLMEDRWKKGC
jgi:hypothetical protein